jgi:hypothetical protein
VSTLWKLASASEAEAPAAEGGDAFVRLLTDSITREAGLLNELQAKYNPPMRTH